MTASQRQRGQRHPGNSKQQAPASHGPTAGNAGWFCSTQIPATKASSESNWGTLQHSANPRIFNATCLDVEVRALVKNRTNFVSFFGFDVENFLIKI
jgi:hypothetical protein